MYSYLSVQYKRSLTPPHRLMNRTEWKDADTPDQIQFVHACLQQTVKTLSSFEVYKTEVESGHLSWSPVHEEQFFRENCEMFSERSFELVGKLVGLLRSDDPVTIAVACFDLGTCVCVRACF